MLSCLYPRFIFESAVMFVNIATGKEYFCGSENTLTIVLVMKLVCVFVVGSRTKYINTHTLSGECKTLVEVPGRPLDCIHVRIQVVISSLRAAKCYHEILG